eukprot:149359-Pyramimonas_sp.AAC.1
MALLPLPPLRQHRRRLVFLLCAMAAQHMSVSIALVFLGFLAIIDSYSVLICVRRGSQRATPSSFASS